MAKNQIMRLAVALLFGSLAMLITGFLYKERDLIFEWSWAKAHGSFDSSPDDKLLKAAHFFAESKHPGLACVEKWLGKDEKYVYLALGCARFEESLGEVKAYDGNSNFLATRMHYSGDSILSMEQPPANAYQNGLHRLFPREAADKLTSSLPEFYSRGLERMAQIRGK